MNALLPAMQFSLAPWDYGKDATKICRRYADLHTEFAPRILALAREATETGHPIIRPLFWLDENDEKALTCEDEFLLGDELLVAPVVKPNQRQRDILLPPGTWKDHQTGRIYRGATTLSAYPAPLETLPIFIRIDE